MKKEKYFEVDIEYESQVFKVKNNYEFAMKFTSKNKAALELVHGLMLGACSQDFVDVFLKKLIEYKKEKK